MANVYASAAPLHDGTQRRRLQAPVSRSSLDVLQRKPVNKSNICPAIFRDRKRSSQRIGSEDVRLFSVFPGRGIGRLIIPSSGGKPKRNEVDMAGCSEGLPAIGYSISTIDPSDDSGVFDGAVDFARHDLHAVWRTEQVLDVQHF